MEKLNQPEYTVSVARQHIEVVRAQIAQMGANDSEHSDLDELVRKLEDGDITPADAIAAADSIQNSKQAYH